MDAVALQSLVSFARRAYDHAEQCAEKAEAAEMIAIIAWAHVRKARERMRARRIDRSGSPDATSRPSATPAEPARGDASHRPISANGTERRRSMLARPDGPSS